MEWIISYVLRDESKNSPLSLMTHDFETWVQLGQVNIQIVTINEFYSLYPWSFKAMDPTHKSQGFETYYQETYLNITCN